MPQIDKLLDYKRLIDVDECTQMKILEWRNHPTVRNNMFNNRVISVEEHIAWLRNLVNADRETLVVYLQDRAIGVLVHNIDYYNKTGSGGLYLDPSLEHYGIGALIQYDSLDIVFLERDVEKVSVEILSSNRQVISMHKRFGLTKEGLLRSNVLQDGVRLDIQLMGITKSEWLAKRVEIKPMIEIFIENILLSADKYTKE